MDDKKIFSKVIQLIILGVICFVATVVVAMVLGSYDKNIFNFKSFNFANVIPIIFIGGFISCVVVGVGTLFVSKSIKLKFELKGGQVLYELFY